MTATSDTYDYQRVAEAIKYIQDNFKRQPELEEVADAVHLSPYHFQRMFTAWAGLSPKKYLQFISGEFAKKLMNGGDFSLNRVAYETGLSGSSRLHDLFVSMEAMTPGEYKDGGRSLEITYGYYDTPFGEVLLANTRKGICKLAFVDSKKIAEDRSVPLRVSALAELTKEWPNATIVPDEGAYDLLVRRIFSQDLFKDKKNKVKLNIQGTPFQIKVWEALLKIPAGELASYNQVAEMIWRPLASRAVGTAIGRNPVAVLIPCHRVIKRAGGISGYRWDPDRKLAILNWEHCQAFTEDEINQKAAS